VNGWLVRRRPAHQVPRALAGAVALLAAALTLATAIPKPADAGSHPTVGGAQLSGRGVIVNYPARDATRLPHVPASAYVIADAGDGKVLAAKNPHGHFAPASTLKVLTADALMPVLNPRETVMTSHAAAVVTPSKVGLVEGRRYRVSDLFTALLLISANDAAISLAKATGSFPKGIALINAEARHLQADDTVAKMPNGLDAKGQHVSAYDEALFARQALTMPAFMRIEAMRLTRFPLHRRHSVTLYNQNTMLKSYRGDLGGKIGWTTPAKATFIGWARRGGHTLIVTILHCTPLKEMAAAARLLDWGFDVDGKVKPVGILVRPLAASARAHPVPGAGHSQARLALDTRFPTLPLAAAAGALLLTGFATAAVLSVLRRRSQAGSRSGH
jgi:D-alanyl-D-alanine carboxypeptidase (penicillin-binding protein 5/6)